MASSNPYVSRKPITPGSIVVRWTIGATTYALTDWGDGTLGGDGGGTASYYDGTIRVRPHPAPQPSDGNFSIEFEEWDDTEVSKRTTTETPINDTLSISLPSSNVQPGSLVFRIVMLQYPGAPGGLTGVVGVKQPVDIVIRDDGNGSLKRYGGGTDGAIVGTINYTTGAYTLDARANYEYREFDFEITSFVWELVTGTDEYDLLTDMEIEWVASADASIAASVTRPVENMNIRLLPGLWQPTIPGSLLFSFGNKTYRDRDGAILTDWSSTTDAGDNVGSIDYQTGVVTLVEYPAGLNANSAATVIALATTYGERVSGFSKFRTAGAPLRQGSLIINATTLTGVTVSAQAGTNGVIADDAIRDGFVDTETGIVSIEWDDPIYPSTLKYSAVAYSHLPLDPDLLGLDPTRLPSDGRVPIFLPGDVGVVSHTIETAVASPTAGAALTFTRDHQAEVWVKGANGLTLDPLQYALDREAGELTWADPLTLKNIDEDAVTTPLTVYDRVEDMVLITDVQVSGQVSINAQLSQDYPAGEAVFCSAVLHGDLRARVYNLFHQASWTGAWSDERIGSDTTAKYNDIAYPIEITNQGSIQERWRVSFTSSTFFQVIGESVGVIGTGDISSDCAIANPATGAPYFTIRKDGWGSGWSAGSQMRFNTDGAQAPFWVARTILSGPATAEEDSFATQNRGDAD